MKRRVGALLMALVLVMTGFAAYAEEDQPAEMAVEDSVEDASVPEEEPVEGETAVYFEEEPVPAVEEPVEAAEPEATPETSANTEAEPEKQTTAPEETQSEEATETETTVETEETEKEDILTYTALSGNLSVTVEVPLGALPDDVQLYMQSVDENSDEYEEVQSYVQESGEEASNLEIADIYFTLDEEKVDPSEAVTVKLGLATFTDADSSSLKAWDYTDRMQGTFNAETQEVEFVTTNLQTFAATWEDGQGFSEDTDLDGNDEQGTEVNNENEDYFSGLSLEVSHRIANEDDADEDNESYQAGTEIVFEIVVTNNGEFPISDIEVTNNLTAPSEPISSLDAKGDSETREVYYTISEKDENAGSVQMDVTVTGHYIDDTDPDNPEDDTVEISATDIVDFAFGIMPLGVKSNPDLTVEMTETSSPKDGRAYQAEEEIIYEIKVTNTGEVDLRDIALEDLLTSDLLDKIAFLHQGYHSTCSTSYIVTEDDVENGSVINMAIATTADDIPFYSEVVEVPTEIGPRLSVEYEITSTPKNGEAYQEGEPITYTITVTNTGDVELSNIKVTDELTQKSWEIKTLQPGESKSYDVEYVIQGQDATSSSPDSSPELSIKADAVGEYKYGSDKSEPVSSENTSDEDPEETEIEIEPRPQKFVDIDEKDHDFKDADKEVEVGQTLTYQITYKNANTKTKTVTITDQLPDSLEYVSDSATGPENSDIKYDKGTITWTINDVQPKDKGSVTFRAKVTENSTGGISNSATVKIGNKKTQTYEVYNPRKNDSPQSPTKSVSAGDSTVSIGQELTYTIKYYNHHNDVETVTITDELDDGLTYLNNTVSNGGEYDSGTITWEVEAAPFTWGEVSFKAAVNKNAGTTVENDYIDEEEEVDDEDGDEEDSLSIAAYSETVTTGSVSNYALVTIGDDEEKVTNVVTNNLYSTSGGSGSGSGSGGEGSGENKAVNTADDTPVAPMAALFGTALAVLGADIIYRRRRTQR